MSIDTYETDRARAILDRIGWPEWNNADKTHFRLSFDSVTDTGWWGDATVPDSSWNTEIDDHIALCILRNHLREWLNKHGGGPAENIRKGKVYWLVSATVGCPMRFDDYDEALLARAEQVLAA